jgi:MFS family permease
VSEVKPASGFSLAKIGLLKPLSVRNFALLWAGSVVSYIGAQLTLIAFPWLVLKLTGDALAMGTVLALASIPRAVFMVFGGAFTDRFSPRTVI